MVSGALSKRGVVLLLVYLTATATDADRIDFPVLKRLDDSAFRRRGDACDEITATCNEWQEECMETKEVCDGSWVSKCTGGWSKECTKTATQCTQGTESVCTKTSHECTGGWKSVCKQTSKKCDHFLPWPLDYICDGWKTVCTKSSVVCQGWEEVCLVSKTVCKGMGEVCTASVSVCDFYEDVCEGTVRVGCTAFGETCKSTGTVCTVAVGVFTAVADAVENLGTCLDDAWDENALDMFFDDTCVEEGVPDNNVPAYARSKGSSVADGFVAGVTVPRLSFGVQFGSVHGDKDTAQFEISIGDHDLEIPLFAKQWQNSPIKDIVAIDAETSFSFVNDAKLDVYGTNFDLTIPGIKWDFEAGLTLMAETSQDPCADNLDHCRMVLNKGKTRVFQKAFAAGPVPIVIVLSAKVYLGAYPRLEGTAFAGLRVFFADDGVDLFNSVTLELDKPSQALSGFEDMFDGKALERAIKDKIRFEASGQLEATASLQLCIGVEIGFHVNGVGTTFDVPVCMTATLDVAANADLSGAALQVDASLVLDPMEIPFEFDLPDLSALVDTACGFVQAPMDQLTQASGCVPVVDCFDTFIDETCDGVSDALSVLDLDINLGSVKLWDEVPIWSSTLSLETGGGKNEKSDAPEAGIVSNAGADFSADASSTCSRFDGLNAVSGKAGGIAQWPKEDSVDACEALCVADTNCDIFVWHKETAGGWKNRCVMWSLETARSHGRDQQSTFPAGSHHITGMCRYWAQYDTSASRTSSTCSTQHKIRHYNSGSLEACQLDCETREGCSYVFYQTPAERNAATPLCHQYRACNLLRTPTRPGTNYKLTDGKLANKLRMTFVKTGCPNSKPSIGWWEQKRRERGDAYVWNDMALYCKYTKEGTANARQVEQCCGKGQTCTPTACEKQEHYAGDGAYQLAFRQTMPYLFDAEEWTKSQDDPTANNYAILDDMKLFEHSGRYNFKLVWPNDPTVFYTWSQTSDPTSEAISGYKPIHAPYTGKKWGGLEPSGTSALMDGSVGHGWWFYAIGATKTWSNGIPSYAKSDSDAAYPQQKTELYAYRGFKLTSYGKACAASRVILVSETVSDPAECANLVLQNSECSAKFTVNPNSSTEACQCKKIGPSCADSEDGETMIYDFVNM